jgi:hypothetical protein
MCAVAIIFCWYEHLLRFCTDFITYHLFWQRGGFTFGMALALFIIQTENPNADQFGSNP